MSASNTKKPPFLQVMITTLFAEVGNYGRAADVDIEIRFAVVAFVRHLKGFVFARVRIEREQSVGKAGARQGLEWPA